jgi:hypothetical protein
MVTQFDDDFEYNQKIYNCAREYYKILEKIDSVSVITNLYLCFANQRVSKPAENIILQKLREVRRRHNHTAMSAHFALSSLADILKEEKGLSFVYNEKYQKFIFVD